MLMNLRFSLNWGSLLIISLESPKLITKIVNTTKQHLNVEIIFNLFFFSLLFLFALNLFYFFKRKPSTVYAGLKVNNHKNDLLRVEVKFWFSALLAHKLLTFLQFLDTADFYEIWSNNRKSIVSDHFFVIYF